MFQIEVAVPSPLAQTFTYKAPIHVVAGCRVLVPFGVRKVVGVVLSSCPYEADQSRDFALKEVAEIVDSEPVYSEIVIDIAKWMSQYYMHPIGEVLRGMLPAANKKTKRERLRLTDLGVQERADLTSQSGQILLSLFGAKKSEVAAITAKSRLKRLLTEPHIDTKMAKISVLKRRGLITLDTGTSISARKTDTVHQDNEPTDANCEQAIIPELTPLQQKAVATMRDALHEPSKAQPFLLHGITGAGKTEVYLHLIHEILSDTSVPRQVLVLVPEISLTPQMTRIFTRRFPGRVAVVHSAMADGERWAQLNRVRNGTASILIGPRSAVFGPFKNLDLIIVDEEHDASYKQSSGLAYNGRDVAVLRARMEKAVVVLGSATPSLESYQNALSGRYTLIEMLERATGRPLPTVSVVIPEQTGQRRGGILVSSGDSRQSTSPITAHDAEIPMHPAVVKALQENLAAGRQAIVLVNRRGYAYYLYSVYEKKPVVCPHCSISMTLHARSTVLRCHYCDSSQAVAALMAEHPEQKYVAIGYGSQKAEDALKKYVPEARVVRLDSDAVVDRDLLPQTLERFRAGEIDILVGTQILAKGHDFPNVTLIVVLEVDQLLGLPDFRAGERAFQLLVQSAGRAGRAALSGHVIMQTMRPSHAVLAAAINQDYAAFVKHELDFRKNHAYPPFVRMIAVEVNSANLLRLNKLAFEIESWLEQGAARRPELFAQVRMLGPAVPPIETIRGRHRRQLIFSSPQVSPLRTMVGWFLRDFQKLGGDLRMRIDVDPQSLI
ncbi:MAG: primosomal protein N' [Deltaproteobacteria bacterium]|nr:primosomal protein N' [Deltaproteobacteria bacterium]